MPLPMGAEPPGGSCELPLPCSPPGGGGGNCPKTEVEETMATKTIITIIKILVIFFMIYRIIKFLLDNYFQGYHFIIIHDAGKIDT